MAFNKKGGKFQKKEADGKLSLWSAASEKPYLLSGTVTIDEVKFRVFLYENNDPLYDNSPEYYGSLYLVEEEEEAPKKKFNSNVGKASKSPKVAVKKITPAFDEDDYEEVDI